MLEQVFKSILLMSAVGSVLSVFWLCLKPVTRKLFSPRWLMKNSKQKYLKKYFLFNGNI